MRYFLQRMLVVMTALGFVFAPYDFGQSPRVTANMILEVIATHATSESEDKYVYLRVFSDGTAECETSRHRNSESKEFPTVKKMLSQDELIRIKSMASDPKLATLGPKYETRYAIVDSWTEWTIKIQRTTGDSQIIEVLEFSPDLAKVMKHPYPDALVRLGCSIAKSRADVSGDSISLDDECKRVLGRPSQPKS